MGSLYNGTYTNTSSAVVWRAGSEYVPDIKTCSPQLLWTNQNYSSQQNFKSSFIKKNLLEIKLADSTFNFYEWQRVI